MADWGFVLVAAALGGALFAVTSVGRRNDVLRARCLTLKAKHERLRRHVVDLTERVSRMAAELRAARVQAARVPLLLDQLKDRDSEIERLQNRHQKVVRLPRPASRPGETTATQPDEPFEHDVLLFSTDHPSAEPDDPRSPRIFRR